MAKRGTIAKKTINVVVRFDERELAIAERNRRVMAKEIESLHPGIKFTLSAMIRSLAIGRRSGQEKQRITAHCDVTKEIA